MSIQERMAQLAPRERRLLGVLGMVALAFVVLGVPTALMAMESAKRSENEALRQAVQAIEGAGEALARSAAKREAVVARYRSEAPPIASWLDRLARAEELEAIESQDRAVVPHGKKYDERSTKVMFRRAGLAKLVHFMESVVKSSHPVLISKLNIRKRSSEPDSFDVEMFVSAFDRKEQEKKVTTPAPDASAVHDEETEENPDEAPELEEE